MADPFVLGVSSGAALGASVTMVFLKEIEFLEEKIKKTVLFWHYFA